MASCVPEKLKAAMDSAGKSIADLSYDARVPYQRIYSIINNITPNPRIETLVKIAAALDVTVDDLVRDQEDNNV